MGDPRVVKADSNVNGDTDNQVNEEDEEDSADEALCEMLGLTSLGEIVDEADPDADENDVGLSKSSEGPRLSRAIVDAAVQASDVLENFQSTSVCIFPRDLSVPGAFMRRITDELVWAGTKFSSDRTYETIRVWKQGEIEERRVLTRLENFVNNHEGWNDLCNGHLRQCISAAIGTEMVLYKEKLNLKPPGGSGFAPHLDTPSLRVALGKAGPQTFVTVMVAIDDMTVKNGCLRIHKGNWSEENHCPLIAAEEDGNPDAGGRAGAIPLDAAETMDFDDIMCRGGDIVAFNGYAPHRSGANLSPLARRAVFLTYNPKSEGDFHDTYYERMNNLRNDWRARVGLAQRQLSPDEQAEMDALTTIPTI